MSYEIIGEIIYKSPTEEKTVPNFFKDRVTGNPLTLTSATATIVDSDDVDVSEDMIGNITFDAETGCVYVDVLGGDSKKKYTLRIDIESEEHPKLRMSRAVHVNEAKA